MIDNYNPNQLQYNAINPKAMGNMTTLQDLNGVQNPGTGTRTVGTAFTGTNPNTQIIGPTVYTQDYTLGTPVSTPQNVQTKIMPDNNLQTY